MVERLKLLNGKNSLSLAPTQVLVLSFLLVILVGAGILNMPFSSADGKSVGYVDALFTSTSAVCVTGLVTVDSMTQWNFFGKIVIMFLIQIGGLGFMTLVTMFFILVGKKISLKERLLIQESMNQTTLSGMVKLVKNVVIGTFIIEGIGALFLMTRFVPIYGIRGIPYAVFHSVSAFCNAGFDIIEGDSLQPFRGDIMVNITIMGLIIIGGIGFKVWADIILMLRSRQQTQMSWRSLFIRLSLHTKMVLSITAVLIIIPAIFFFFLEGFNPETMGNDNIVTKILGSFFQSVTTRTAGFNSIPMAGMTDASKFLSIILMFIGGSPGGTAGGVKTVTFGVLLLVVYSVLVNKESTEAFNRSIPADITRKAFTVVFISIVLVFSVTMLLSLTESASFMDVLFETTSAFATVGLSLGLTGSLTTAGKLILCLTMFAGRLGPVTMVLALAVRKKKVKAIINKPEEKVMVG